MTRFRGESITEAWTQRDSRLSLLMVPETFPNLLQPYVLNIFEYLLKRGCELTIATHGRLGDCTPAHVLELDLLSRTRYFPVESAGDVLRGLRPYVLPFTSAGRRAYRGLRKVLASRKWRPSGLRGWAKTLVRAPLLGESRFDLVHAHNLHAASDYLFAARVFDVPLVVTFHGLPTIGGSGMLVEQKAAELFRSGSVFLVNTAFARRQLEELACPPQKICILPQGLRMEDFPFRPRPFSPGEVPIILTVARLSLEKGHRYALEAVRMLRRSGRQVEYRIVGKGYERAKLEQTVRELGIKDCVRLMGDLSDSDLEDEYAHAHIFVLPSIEDLSGYHTETQGVVIQEAQASGLLVVTTRTGGIPECVDDGRSAFLVPERNADAMAEKIAWLLDHPDQWETWQRAGRAWVETQFAMEKIGQRLWEVYTDVLEAHTKAARD